MELGERPARRVSNLSDSHHEKHANVERKVSLVELLPSKIEIIRRISGGYLLENPPPPDDKAAELARNRTWGEFAWSLLTYKTLWTLYYLVPAFIGGAVICAIDHLPFIDGLFLASSAMIGVGLSTVSMLQVSSGSFIVIVVLMCIGSSTFMLMVTTSIRKFRFKLVHDTVVSAFRSKDVELGDKLSAQDREVIAYYKVYNSSLEVLIQVFAMYFFGLPFIGTFAVYGALFIKPLAPELAARNIGRFSEAGFLAVSTAASCGLTLTSDSLVSKNNNPTVYVLLSVLVLAANTCAPIFLRLFVKLLVKIDNGLTTCFPMRMRRRAAVRYRKALLFILANPRKLTTHIFDQLQTIYLAITVLIFCSVQYVFFLASTLNRNQALAVYSKPELAWIGYFQTVSTRNAGFTTMDFRLLSEGLLVIYLIMMYLSSFPLVTTMHGSEVHDDAEVNRLQSQSFKDRLTMEHTLEASPPPSPDARLTTDMLHAPHSVDFPNSLPPPPPPPPPAGGTPEATLGTPRGTRRSSAGDIIVRNRRDSIETIAIKKAAAEAVRQHDLEQDRRQREQHIVLEDDSSLPDSCGDVPEKDVIAIRTPNTSSMMDHANALANMQRSLGLDVDVKKRTPDRNKYWNSSQAASNYNSEDDDEEEEEQEAASNISDCSDRASMHSSLREEESIDHDAFKQMNESFAHQFLFRHTFFLVIAVIILAYSEESLLAPDNPADVNLFYIMFEIVSAYGSVGLSLGVPGEAYSLSGAMTTVGKLTIIAVMVLGKHRGLPSSSDEVIDYEFADYKKAWHWEPTKPQLSNKIERRRSSSSGRKFSFLQKPAR